MKQNLLFYLLTTIIFSLLIKAQSSYNSDLPGIISLHNVENNNTYLLTHWKLITEDNSKWQYDFNDYETAEKINSLLPVENRMDSVWNDIVYFQNRIFVDSSLVNKNLGFYFIQAGAAVIYLNGEQIYSIGTIFPSGADEIKYYDRNPHPINLIPGVWNNIAVRFSNHEAVELWDQGNWSGFQFSIGLLNDMIQLSSAKTRHMSLKETTFIVIPITLALIHLFLFLFNTKQRQNIIYSIFLSAFILLIYSSNQTYFENEIQKVFFLNKIQIYALLLTTFFASASIRSIFKSLGVFDAINFLLFICLSVYINFVRDDFTVILIYAFISYLFTVTGFSIFYPHSKKGISILRVGYVLMSASGIYQMLQNYQVVPVLFNEDGIFIYGVLSFIISMSIYLAYEFIRTGNELEQRVEEVKVLSKENYQKELEAKQKEIENKILEADNERKTRELEDARQLQLSMLPARLPSNEYFDIAVRMETAAEVGGDYYDSIKSDSGILNITLGDATGHGNKAGIMVAITKSLFITLGSSLLIPDFFKRCTAVIRKMKLGNLFMSMIVMRTNGRDVILSSAGMPPILHYIKKKNSVREILIKSMPLGAVKDFPYDTEEFSLESGDVLLLFSDGIIELFNEKKEFFGLKRLINTFAGAVSESPDGIIQKIFEQGEKWRGVNPINDDITILALKVK